MIINQLNNTMPRGRPRKHPESAYSPTPKEDGNIPSEVSQLITGVKSKPIMPILQNNNNYRYQDQADYWKRDEFGLLPNVNYIFKEDEPNKIDWFKMIPKKYLVANKDKCPEGTDFSTLNVEELDDSQLLILLAGMRWLSSIRGYTSIRQKIVTANEQYVAAECEIVLIPNFETNMKEIVFVGEGEAHLNNTKSFARNFLVPIACNRAFVRAWRNALEIPVLGADELGDSKTGVPEESATSATSRISPIDVLRATMRKTNISFEKIKSTYIKEGSLSGASEDAIKWKDKAQFWDSEESIEPLDILAIIKRINDKAKVKSE